MVGIGMIDPATLRPFPSWGEPVFDELVTVFGRKGIVLSYRVTEVAADRRIERPGSRENEGRT